MDLMANFNLFGIFEKIYIQFFSSLPFLPKVVLNNLKSCSLSGGRGEKPKQTKIKTPTKHGHWNWPKYIFTYFSSTVALTKNLCRPKITNLSEIKTVQDLIGSEVKRGARGGCKKVLLPVQRAGGPKSSAEFPLWVVGDWKGKEKKKNE